MSDSGPRPTTSWGRERTCPACGTTAVTAAERCPSCGSRYDRAPRGRRARRIAILVVAGSAAVGAAAVVVLATLGAADREARDRDDRRAAMARERDRLVRLQAPHRGGAPRLRPRAGAPPAARLQTRRALVGATQRAITADARRLVRAGEIDGPIARTECGPVLRSPDAVPDDRVLGKPVGRYDCVAVRRDVRGPDGGRLAALGYAYVTAVDFRRASWTFCRNVPPQGERGPALTHVRLARACLAAKGRALGTGYVDEDPARPARR
jgi:hypothetical protein